MKMSKIRKKVKSIPRSTLALWIITILGAAAFSIHLWANARGQLSVIDEGLYLIKGFLFATGRYTPFQDGGPWTNHMPFSFLIPGWVQQYVEPGLRTARYYAIGLGGLFILGLWIVTRRLGGKWLAAFAIWIFAINPAIIKILSQALSQGIILVMFVWVLVLILGNSRPTWQVISASVLAGLMLLTRLNMAAVLPLLIIYIFWEHGTRKGWIALLSGILVVVFGHALFWPDILKIWVYWLPSSITPFLDHWRDSSVDFSLWSPSMSLYSRLDSLLISVRTHLIPFLGAIFLWLSWPRTKKPWPKKLMGKSAVFLTTLLIVLFFMHAWASLGQNYCVYCLQIYSAFFSFIGVLLFVLAARRWYPNISQTRQFGIIIIIGILSIIISLPLITRIVPFIQELQIVRISELRLLPGTSALSNLITNKFGISSHQQQRIGEFVLWSLALALILMIISLGRDILRKQTVRVDLSKHICRLAVIVSAWLVILTLAFGYHNRAYDCGEDVIDSYETAGKFISDLIPSGSKVYWLGGQSPTLLLYLPQVEIYPPQLNMAYTYRLGGNPEEMLRFGSWNKALAEEWLQESDFVLLEHDKVNDGIARTFLEIADEYHEVATSPPVLDCRPDSYIHVYKRDLD